MEHRERREPLGLSDLLLVYHDFLLALSRRTERLIQDFNAFIQCFNGRWMAADCHKWADSKICLCMADKKPAGAGYSHFACLTGFNFHSVALSSISFLIS
ncbi:hypothetical protein ACYUTZ_002711 [Escherichia coli]